MNNYEKMSQMIPIVKNPHFRPWVQKVFPGIYDDSLTTLQLLGKLILYINEMNDQQDEIIKWMEEVTKEQNENIDFMKELMKTFMEDMEKAFNEFKKDVLDSILGGKVTEILNEWFENGKLAEIINNEVFNMKADKKDLEVLDNWVKDNLMSRLKILKRNKKGFLSANNVGDSMSHGSASDFSDINAFSGIVRRGINLDFDTNNHGYVNFYQPSGTVDIMRTFSGAGWQFNTSLTTPKAHDQALGFISYYSETVDALATGFFRQANYFKFKFMALEVSKHAEGGNVEIRVNGNVMKTIDCSSATATTETHIIDVSKFDFLNSVQFKNLSGKNELLNLYWYDDINKIMFNNYANSGERLSGLTDAKIDSLFDCNLLIFSLGYNGIPDNEMDVIFDKCKKAYEKYKPIMLVNDLCWAVDRKSTSEKLKKFANDTDSLYFRTLPVVQDANELKDKGFLKDLAHPTNMGHEIIGAKVLEMLRTTFTSKSSINYVHTARENSDKVNNLYETGIIIYKGKLDKDYKDYPYFNKMKIAMELKIKSGELPNGVFIGAHATLPAGLYLYLDDQASTISNALPLTKGEHIVTSPTWSAVQYEAKISIGADISVNGLPTDKRGKFTGAVVNEYTTEKTSLKDLLLYN